jgi:hypothetical protein
MIKNKFKYFIYGSSVGLFSLLFSLITTSAAHAAGITLYWCNTGNGNFSTASNWNTNADCTSGSQQVPVSGDILVFDTTIIVADAALNNDINGLDINSINFTGTNSSNYTITGNSISLDNGITDTSRSNLNQISLDITLTANQSFINLTGSSGLIKGNFGLTNILNIGNHTLTLSSNTNTGGKIIILSRLQGTGNIVMNGDNSGNYYFTTPDNGFSGNVTLENGQAFIYDNSVGTGKITVKDGATLNINFDTLSPTFSNPLEIAGNGYDGTSGSLLISDGCPTPINNGTCTNTGTDTFTGAITLAGDTIVSTGGNTVDFTNIVQCSGFSITMNVIPVILPGIHPATTPSCNAPTGGGSTTPVPKTPVTGSILNSSRKYLVYSGLLAILSSGLYILSKRQKKAYTRKKK